MMLSVNILCRCGRLKMTSSYLNVVVINKWLKIRLVHFFLPYYRISMTMLKQSMHHSENLTTFLSEVYTTLCQTLFTMFTVS